MSLKSSLARLLGAPSSIANMVNMSRKHVTHGENLVLSGRISLHGSGTIAIGNNVTIHSKPSVNPTACGTQTFLRAEAPGKILVGNNVGISHSAITSYESITIDDDVLIGSNCMVTDTDFHSVEYDYRMEHPDTHVKSAPVHICKGAFIGARSIILKGVTVGEKSVVAAGSVVTKDVPPSELWGGCPAKFIRKL